MKIALVHDFLWYWGGAERVLQGLTTIFPHAPLYTLYYKPSFTKEYFWDQIIHASFLQYIPLPHRFCLPFMPSAAESLRLDAYDVVISSGAFAKGVITRPGTTHIHYCHTPPRFLWEDSHSYLSLRVPRGLKIPALFSTHWLRLWDAQAAKRPDIMLANSRWTQYKIKKIYQRDSRVIYPFVEISKQIKNTKYKIQNTKYFLIVSRLQPYKNIDLAIQACNELKLSLVIAGVGPDEKRLKRLAGETIKFLGFVEEDELASLYDKARAIILPGIEDFGLVPLEAMAQGTPVLAYRQGGAIETIKEGETGVFFNHLTVPSLIKGIKKILNQKKAFNKKTIIAYSRQFSWENFKTSLLNVVNNPSL